MSIRWIDFKAIKAQVPIRDVLARLNYLTALREKSGGKLVGSCPIHGGTSGNSFHVDTGRNIWNCFAGCGGGNVLDLVMRAESCELREAGEKIASWFGLTFDPPDGKERPRRMSQDQRSESRQYDPTPERADAASSGAAAEAVINPPLAAPLKTLNHDHRYLFQRGLTVPTIKTFGPGFCVRGLMRNRVAIPIHNADGVLVAYAGRAVDDEVANSEGKYKLPGGFQKSHVLYNLNRAKEHAKDGLVCVEGFFSAMLTHQAGFPNVVALMGSSLSKEQEELLLAHTDRLALMFDGDDAGEKCLREFYGRLRRRMYLREIHLEDGEQPDSLTAERIRELLA